jgi:hypothetical protein
MGTVANAKNTFTRRLEILQSGSNESRTTLQSVFLSKTENYSIQVERFVTNTTPVINLIEGPYLEIYNLPPEGHGNYINVGAPVASFSPDNPKTVLEVMYQLNEFVKEQSGLGLNVRFEPGFEIRFTMHYHFQRNYFIKFNNEFASLMHLPEYTFFFRNYADDGDSVSTYPQTLENLALLFYGAGTTILQRIGIATSTLLRSFDSGRSLKSLDTRLSYDIMCTLNTDSKIEVLGGVESRKKLLARFPIGELISRYDILDVVSKQNSVSEIVNVGLEDLTRKNPDSQILNLGNGEVLVLNTKIECRYMQDQKIVTTPADFVHNGFFFLQLLFSKRLR